MTARKKRPVMYEVASRSRRARRMTSWRSGPPPPPPPSSPAASAPIEPEAPPVDSPEDAEPLITESVPFMEVYEGRVFLSLGWAQWAIVAAVLLALLAGAFYAGQRSATPEAPPATGTDFLTPGGDEGDEAVGGPLEPDHRDGGRNVRTPIGGNEVARPTPSEPEPEVDPEPRQQPTLEPGNYYVLVQYFPRSRPEHAQAAAQFLRENGVECLILRKADLRLYAAEPFGGQQAARRLVSKIRKLGAEYFEQGGGYKFDGCEIHHIR